MLSETCDAWEQHEIGFTASVWVMTLDRVTLGLEGLLPRADTALYAAKQQEEVW